MKFSVSWNLCLPPANSSSCSYASASAMVRRTRWNRLAANWVSLASAFARLKQVHLPSCVNLQSWSDCAVDPSLILLASVYLTRKTQSPHRREAFHTQCSPPVGTLFVLFVLPQPYVPSQISPICWSN